MRARRACPATYENHRSNPVRSSEIRLTLENISNIPVDFYKLSFDDSTTGPAQQLLADGELSVAEAYETEYDLLYRPFFTWTAPKPLPAIASRKRIVVPVKCYGKVGWCVQHCRVTLVAFLAGIYSMFGFFRNRLVHRAQFGCSIHTSIEGNPTCNRM